MAYDRLKMFLGLCEDLGTLIVADKIETGACIALLSMTIDTVKMETRLLPDRLGRCLTLVRMYQNRKHMIVSLLESLTCLLTFACTCHVVAPCRPFL